jgi:hypothetical protein
VALARTIIISSSRVLDLGALDRQIQAQVGHISLSLERAPGLDRDTLEINAKLSLTRIFSCGTGFGSTGNSGFGSTNTTGGGLFGGGSTGGFGSSGGMSTVLFCSGSFCWTRSLMGLVQILMSRSALVSNVSQFLLSPVFFAAFLRLWTIFVDLRRRAFETPQLDDRKSR